MQSLAWNHTNDPISLSDKPKDSLIDLSDDVSPAPGGLSSKFSGLGSLIDESNKNPAQF